MVRRRFIGWLGVGAFIFLSCASAATPTVPRVAPTATLPATAAPRPTSQASATATPTPKPSPPPTAASVGPRVGGVARHPHREDSPSWDPSRTHVDPMNTTKYLVFTKLLTNWSDKPEHCRSEPYPLGVQKWRWVDDTTAEFTLVQGMKYHNKPPVNGREVVAQDMPAAFERYKKNLSFMAGKSAIVESVTATDKYTFRMKLKSPWGSMMSELIAYFYGPWIEPAEAGGPKGELWEQPDKSWIGSGPFMFDKWQPGVKWRLVRNPDYWVKGKPYLEAVEYLVMPEVSTQLASLRAGQLNFIRDYTEEFIDVAKQAIPGLQVARCPGGTMSGAAILWMNNSGPPFDDVRVRRAAVMAIDQESIIKSLYKGRAAVVRVLPPSTQYALALSDFPPDVRPFVEYNPSRAKQLLAEAGYPNGLDTVLNFTPRFAAPAPMVAEAVTAMLNAVGIKAKLNWMEYARILETVHQAKYPVGQIAITPRTAVTPEDGHALTGFWSQAGAVNRSIVRDPEYDKLFEQFRVTTDENKRKDLARQLQIMIASKAYAVPLPLTDSTMTASPGFHFTWVGNSRDYSMLLETAWMD